MNIFYNAQGVGDVLLVQLKPNKPHAVETANENDITWLTDERTKEIIGFNLFHASKYVEVNQKGSVDVTKELIATIQKALVDNGSDFILEKDIAPSFVVGRVVSKEKHPNADKLNICMVDTGDETVQIVCGAANVAADQLVVVAKVGAVMPSGTIIRDAELRGIASSGMICSAVELGLPNAEPNTGILVLDESYTTGTPFLLS